MIEVYNLILLIEIQVKFEQITVLMNKLIHL